MTRYLIRRLLWIIPVLFAVSLITFTLMHAVPGGPWAREKALPANVIAALNAKYGLDDPVPLQYIHWVGNLLQGNLGPSYKFVDRSVNDIVGGGLMVTIQLGLMAFALSVLVGIPLGIFAALGHNRWPDYLSTGISVIGIAMPSFVLAILLILFFGVTLHVLPTKGWKGPDTWILPTIALAGFPIAVIARYTRASMLEVTRKDYIRTAQSKGVADGNVVTRHMIRNALIPVVTILGPTLAFLVTGSFIIETIFAHPRRRPLLHHLDQPARLWGADGDDDPVRLRRGLPQPRGRCGVRLHRPPHPLQLGRSDEHGDPGSPGDHRTTASHDGPVAGSLRAASQEQARHGRPDLGDHPLRDRDHRAVHRAVSLHGAGPHRGRQERRPAAAAAQPPATSSAPTRSGATCSAASSTGRASA